jgi:hypothetical protein
LRKQAVTGVQLLVSLDSHKALSNIIQWLGWFLAAFGTGLLINLEIDTSITAYIFLSLISGFGYGILYPARSFTVQAPAFDEDLPFAGAMFSSSGTLWQTLGVAIGGNIFQNILKSKINKDPLLSAYGKADFWSKDASALVLFVKALPIGQQTLREALVKV